MKALVYTEPFHLECRDFPDPEVGEEDVLVRVKACGICGSDVHGFAGKTGRRIPPVIMGHEASGKVEAVGRRVQPIRRGDRVCFDSTVYCNRCNACRGKQYNRCEHRRVLGVSTPEFKRHGAFAGLVAVPWWSVFRLPDHVSFLQAALIEPLSIGLHAVNLTAVSENKIVVIGAGPVGLCIIRAAKLKGAGKIIVSDINDFRLGVAKDMGADVVVNPERVNLKEAVFKETDGEGAHATFEVVGLERTFQQGLTVTRAGGYLTVVGLLEKTVTFDLQQFVSGELTIRGSYASAGEYRESVDLVTSGKVDVQPLISKVMPLSQGQEAFDLLHRGEEDLVKVILEP